MNIVCWLLNVIGSYFNIREAAEARNAMAFAENFCVMLNRTVVIANFRKETFHITHEMCSGYVLDTLRCTLKKTDLRDVEWGKYTVSHFKKLLL